MLACSDPLFWVRGAGSPSELRRSPLREVCCSTEGVTSWNSLNVTKDSSFLVSVDALTEVLRASFGADAEVVLFTDLVRDSIPSHLIGAKVFLVSNKLSRRVVKLGLHQDLLIESDHIENVRNALLRSHPLPDALDVRIPEPYRVGEVVGLDLAILELEFCGLHTLERYRATGSVQNISAGLSAVVERLKRAGIVWPAAMPRNISEGVSLKGELSLAALDWERAALDADAASRDTDFYSRCMELREESAPCLPNVLPYWSTHWPRPEELATAVHMQSCNIDLSRKPDPRFAQFAEMLHLGSVVADVEYWRLIQVFCMACESPLAIHSNLYALDHLSEWLGVDWRVECSVLLWYLTREHQEQKVKLSRVLTSGADRTYLRWRAINATSDMAHRDEQIVRKIAEAVDDIAESALTHREWRPYVRDAVAQFIAGRSRVEYAPLTVLCMLE